MTAAIRGCLARKLMARGALCVISTLARVYADIASFFVGELLSRIYLTRGTKQATHLHQLFFKTQTLASAYCDPLMPLFRRGESDVMLRRKIETVSAEFSAWAETAEFEALEYRRQASLKMDELLQNHDLYAIQRNSRAAGHEFPESLMFSSIGATPTIRLRRN
jgi:hypothetical protein